jgi:chromosome segregation ATPase
MTDSEEMDQLREQIAQTLKQKEALKLAIENATISRRKALRELEQADIRLSALDDRFKRLWDAANPGKSPA